MELLDKQMMHPQVCGIEIKVPVFFSALRNTFEKSAIDTLSKFIEKHQNISKWYLVSDYVFNSSPCSGGENIASFVLVPYERDFNFLINDIKDAKPKDIKERHGIKGSFIRFLKTLPILPIIFMIPKDVNKLPAFDTSDLIDVVNSLEKGMRLCADNSIGNYELSARWIEASIKAESLRRKIISGVSDGKKLVIRQTILVTILISYLTALIRVRHNIKMVGWLSDRDPMQDVAGMDDFTFVGMVYAFYLNLFVPALGGSMKEFMIPVGIPNRAGAVWYDDLIRLPDYFAGCYSKLDESNKIADKALLKLLRGFSTRRPLLAIRFENKGCMRIIAKKVRR